MRHLVLYAIALCVLASPAGAEAPSDVFTIERTSMCRALESTARDADRSVRIIIPEGSPLVFVANMNMRIPHKFAAMYDYARKMKRAAEMGPQGKNMNRRERLKLSLIMGCSHPSVGEFVSYAVHKGAGPKRIEFNFPIVKGTPYPLNVNVCGRDKAGKALCLYGVAFEEWEDTILLVPKL